MKKTIRSYIEQKESKLLFSEYMKLVQMLVIPEVGWKNVGSVKLNVADLIIMGNEDPEKVYERINYAFKRRYISSKEKAQRFYKVNDRYILYEYEDKYRNSNYFMSAAIFPILFFKNVYYPEKLHIKPKATARYRDLNRYLSDIQNIPYIDHELYNYYYERGVNVYDKETLKRSSRIVTCFKNKLY